MFLTTSETHNFAYGSLIFCMDDLEYMATLNYVLFYFHYYNH